jgi:hypothetical protein
MALALFTIFVLSGGGTFGPMLFIDEALDSAKTVIVDDDQRKGATATLKAMKSSASDYTKATKKLAKDMDFDADDREVSNEDIDVFWDDLLALNSGYSKEIVDLRFQLRDQLSRDEWEAMFPAQGSDPQLP